MSLVLDVDRFLAPSVPSRPHTTGINSSRLIVDAGALSHSEAFTRSRDSLQRNSSATTRPNTRSIRSSVPPSSLEELSLLLKRLQRRPDLLQHHKHQAHQGGLSQDQIWELLKKLLEQEDLRHGESQGRASSNSVNRRHSKSKGSSERSQSETHSRTSEATKPYRLIMQKLDELSLTLIGREQRHAPPPVRETGTQVYSTQGARETAICANVTTSPRMQQQQETLLGNSVTRTSSESSTDLDFMLEDPVQMYAASKKLCPPRSKEKIPPEKKKLPPKDPVFGGCPLCASWVRCWRQLSLRLSSFLPFTGSDKH